MKTVTGIRLCTRCKGLCHSTSWRTRRGLRKQYWCSENHLAEDRKDRGRVENWTYVRDLLYEPVNVLTG